MIKGVVSCRNQQCVTPTVMTSILLDFITSQCLKISLLDFFCCTLSDLQIDIILAWFHLKFVSRIVSTKGKFSLKKSRIFSQKYLLGLRNISLHFFPFWLNITSLERKSKINWNWKINVDNFIFQVQFISGFLSYEVIFEQVRAE